MAADSEIIRLEAWQVLEKLERRELSSVEVVRALLERADQVDARVGAFVARFDREALAQAERADQARGRGERLGALHGLPVSVKESIAIAGTDATLGLRSRIGEPAPEDAVVVQQLKAAGAIPLGKTNVPQTLLSFECTNFVFGTTKNPWDPARVPGGSSGGEAAALASGSSLLGVGTDIGGSIRIPAAFSGIAGLKPTEHRWSNRGSATAIAGQEAVRSQIGPMARSTRDLILLFGALPSIEQAAHDPFVPPVPLADPLRLPLRGLRVGVYDDDGFLTPCAAVKRAIKEAQAALEAAGVELVRFEPPSPRESVLMLFAIVSSDGAATLDAQLGSEPAIRPLRLIRRIAHLPLAARRALVRALSIMGETRTAELLAVLGRKPVERLWQLTRERAELRQRELDAWRRSRIDALLCPATVTPAVQHGASRDFSLGASYTIRYNVLNLPAGVVPVTRVRADETDRRVARDRLDKRAASVEAGSAGLPIGVQLVARPFQEHVALALMYAVEQAARASSEFPQTPIEPAA
jgi:fatty acid amide hydrolase